MSKGSAAPFETRECADYVCHVIQDPRTGETTHKREFFRPKWASDEQWSDIKEILREGVHFAVVASNENFLGAFKLAFYRQAFQHPDDNQKRTLDVWPGDWDGHTRNLIVREITRDFLNCLLTHPEEVPPGHYEANAVSQVEGESKWKRVGDAL
jgi:hypothetical protein